ncbi:F-box/kelch-repeat protein [Abeliophyllum distichum]|uniref:F-box/kelch-repeat protein n=1 Tax=Abeliophyllum distichum TaxID=126358 RepID=A0ABD1PQY9_9LAMI
MYYISHSNPHRSFPRLHTRKIPVITAVSRHPSPRPMDSLSPLETSSTDCCRIYVAFCAKYPNGKMCNFIECYYTSNNSWHRVTSIPGLDENQVLKDFAMVSLGDYIYIIGGRLCLKVLDPETDNVKEIDLRLLPWVRRYNVRTDKWEVCAPLSIPRFDFACTVCDRKIYVAGGQNVLGRAKGISSAEFYDPALDEWKSLANMSTMRYKCVGVTWQEKIHVVGGFAHKGNVDRIQGPYTMTRSSAEIYDPQRDKWDFITRMWELDVPPYQIVAVNGKLYSSGDCFKPWKGHIEAYDEKQNIWNEVGGSNLNCLSQNSNPDVKEPDWPSMQMLYFTMAPVGNRLYFMAGYRTPRDASRMRSEVHVFDTSANGDGWRTFEPIVEESEKELCARCCVLKQGS